MIAIGNYIGKKRSFSWATYWTTLYKARVLADGGTIGNESLLKSEIGYILANNLFNKIAFWVDNDFGKNAGNPLLEAPLVSFGLDEGYAADYAFYELFASKGAGRATSYLIGNFIDDPARPEFLTWAQIATMAADGWDFECHTWTHGRDAAYGGDCVNVLLDCTNEQIVEELEKNNEVFLAHGLPYPNYFAYPKYKGDLTRVLPIVAKYRKDARGGSFFYAPMLPNHKKISWLTWQTDVSGGGFDATAVAACKAGIDNAVKYNQGCHIFTHAANTPAVLAGLGEILDYVYSKGLTPLTVKQHYEAIAAYRAKLFNVIQGTNDDTLKDNTPLAYNDNGVQTDKQGIIIFNDTLANIGVSVASHFNDKDYHVQFWEDESDEALAYTFPNNTKYFDGQAVTAVASTNRLVFPFNVYFRVGMKFYLTGTTAPGGLSFNTLYYVQATTWGTQNYVTAKATEGGGVIDITDAGVGVLFHTYGFRDKVAETYIASQRTPKYMTLTRTNFTISNFGCGGNLSDCGLHLLKNLQNITIDLTGNFLGGTIPKEFAYCGGIAYLYLSYNRLTGGLENIMNHYLSLCELKVDRNVITEPLPSSIGKCEQLTSLRFEYNSISGSIPASINNCVKLESIYGRTNLLTGVIPSLSNLVKLQYLELQVNSLTGYTAGAISVGMTDLITVNFGVNALVETAVNQILADCLALQTISGKIMTISLNGGTNAAPTGQGILDKATLITNGCAVTTN